MGTIRVFMRKEYDFSKGRPNPYNKKAKTKITISINNDVLEYFKDMAEQTGISYQNLINLYLIDCKESKRKLKINFQ